jgi:hypothetical protein
MVSAKQVGRRRPAFRQQTRWNRDLLSQQMEKNRKLPHKQKSLQHERTDGEARAVTGGRSGSSDPISHLSTGTILVTGRSGYRDIGPLMQLYIGQFRPESALPERVA